MSGELAHHEGRLRTWDPTSHNYPLARNELVGDDGEIGIRASGRFARNEAKRREHVPLSHWHGAHPYYF